MSAREPREQLVLDLLTHEWDSANTFGETPSITYGWYDDPPARPYANVMQPRSSPVGGGTTGFDGMDSSGGQPVQTISEVVDVHLFAAYGELGNATVSNPREYLTGSADRTTGDVTAGAVGEIKRIVGENGSKPTNPKTGNQPVASLSFRNARPVPEPDDPGVFHQVVETQLVYTTA